MTDPCGVVRLFATAAGRVLCLAGEVDDAAIDSFLRRYGREPVPVDGIDAASVTALCPAGVELLRDHLEAAGDAGRPLTLRLPSDVDGVVARSEGAAGREDRSPSRVRSPGAFA